MVGITPLLGLLGAVSGLVKVFGAFGDAAGQSDPPSIEAPVGSGGSRNPAASARFQGATSVARQGRALDPAGAE
ncbi:MAG: hypothetical protein EBS01_13985, partial [Verrucomicrobia bacterium]|nr:hypothetical protein [Verrucomicrobiota bacterium]